MTEKLIYKVFRKYSLFFHPFHLRREQNYIFGTSRQWVEAQIRDHFGHLEDSSKNAPPRASDLQFHQNCTRARTRQLENRLQKFHLRSISLDRREKRRRICKLFSSWNIEKGMSGYIRASFRFTKIPGLQNFLEIYFANISDWTLRQAWAQNRFLCLFGKLEKQEYKKFFLFLIQTVSDTIITKERISKSYVFLAIFSSSNNLTS